MTACEKRIMITAFVSKALAYIMYSDMERMRVGCFECSGCFITILPNYLKGYKIKPQGIPIGSFIVPIVDANSEANTEDDEDVDTIDDEPDALDE